MILLKRLASALLNATVLLVILLVIGLIVLVGRITDLRDSTAALMAPQAERLERIADAVEGIETRIAGMPPAAAPELAAELAALRAQIPDLSGLHGLTAEGLTAAMLDEIAQRLSRNGESAQMRR